MSKYTSTFMIQCDLLKAIINLLDFPFGQICIHSVCLDLISLLEKYGLSTSEEIIDLVSSARTYVAQEKLKEMFQSLLYKEPEKDDILKITSSIYQDKCSVNGTDRWSYAVSIGQATHKIGFGTSYDDCLQMSIKGMKSAKNLIDSQITVDKGNEIVV
jgi:hypothetical protein